MSYRIAERWAHKHEVDPIALEDYVDFGGFQAVRKVTEMEDQQVLDTLLKANLLGRGGAAYPAGRKWQQMYNIKEGRRGRTGHLQGPGAADAQAVQRH